MESAKIKIHLPDNRMNVNSSVKKNEPSIPQICSLISRRKINEKFRKNMISTLYIPNIMGGDCVDSTDFYSNNFKINYGNKEFSEIVKNPMKLTDCSQYEYKRLLPIFEKFQACKTKPPYSEDLQWELQSALCEFSLKEENQSLLNKERDHKCVIEIVDKLDEESSMYRLNNLTVPLEIKLNKFSTNTFNYLNQLVNSEKMFFDFSIDLILNHLKMFDSFNLYEIIHHIISEEKAYDIKIMLNNLLKDIEKSNRLSKTRASAPNKRSDKHSVKKDIQKDVIIIPPGKKLRSPPNIDFQKVESITEIIKLCSDITLSEKKFPRTKQPENLSNLHNNPGKITNKNSFELSKFKQLIPYNINSNPYNPQKIFVLSPFDQIIKSHCSSSDRRLRSISNKMNCTIDIYGPIKASHVTASLYTSREKVTYHCVITGDSKSNLEKCLKCIKDTFPSTTIREISLT